MKNFDMRGFGGIQHFMVVAPPTVTDVPSMARWFNDLPGQVLPLGKQGQRWAVVGLIGQGWAAGAGDRPFQATALVEAAPADDWAAHLAKLAGAADWLPSPADTDAP
jgi:hypothetical protein